MQKRQKNNVGSRLKNEAGFVFGRIDHNGLFFSDFAKSQEGKMSYCKYLKFCAASSNKASQQAVPAVKAESWKGMHCSQALIWGLRAV